jgi:hypothetical protein
MKEMPRYSLAGNRPIQKALIKDKVKFDQKWALSKLDSMGLEE